MQAKIYDNLYSVEAQCFDTLSIEKLSTFVFQGSKNWDFYFPKIDELKNKDYEVSKNVVLLETKNKKEFESHLKNYPKGKVIDYSIEHTPYYYILVDNDA